MAGWRIHQRKGAQAGFTLVEMMVSLVIGLVAVLGATRVFISGLESFQQVELLGKKQTIISFASNMIIKDIRKADDILDVGANDRLVLIFENSDYCSQEAEKRVYSLSANNPGTLSLERHCKNKSDTEPLINGFSDNGLVIENLSKGYWQIEFNLNAGNQAETIETVVFRAMNRSAIFE